MTKVVLLIEPATVERRALLSELLAAGVDVLPVESPSQALRELKEPLDAIVLRPSGRQLALSTIVKTAQRTRPDLKVFALGASAVEVEHLTRLFQVPLAPLVAGDPSATTAALVAALGPDTPEPVFRLHLTERIFVSPRESVEAWIGTRSDDESPIVRFGTQGSWPEDRLSELALTLERAAKVIHDGLPPSGGVWATEQECFAVAQISVGEPLARTLVERSLPASALLKIAGQVAEAVGALHAAPEGPIHAGPIFPGQIWLRGSGAPWLLMGGMMPIAARHERSRTGETALVPASAEETTGEAYSAKTDVFYAAAFAYLLLSGKEAYPREGDALRYHASVRAGKVRDVRMYRPSLPASLATLLTSALGPDPAARPELSALAAGLLAAATPTPEAAKVPAAAPRAESAATEVPVRPWWKFWGG